jgi:hypothetical protein
MCAVESMDNQTNTRAICGTNGVTYPSLCHLIQDTANEGVAYAGACDSDECSGGSVSQQWVPKMDRDLINTQWTQSPSRNTHTGPGHCSMYKDSKSKSYVPALPQITLEGDI